MSKATPNLCCLAGIGLVGWALYAAHPALCAGFAGLVLMYFGVHLHRRAAGKKAGP